MSTIQKKFVNRVKNLIWENIIRALDDIIGIRRVCWQIANKLGHEYTSYKRPEDYTKGDYYSTLHAIEITYESFESPELKLRLEETVKYILSISEIDLGITFKNGYFIRKGAKLLDEELVNKSLDWLSDKKYKSVYLPFEKGLTHLLEAEKKPGLRNDVITDMYEALEALAKIITKRAGKDLSGNAELFIRSVKASDYYKRLLKEYIAYANIFRHGQDEDKPRPIPALGEVESFIYMTGLFIRLAIVGAA